MAVTLTRIWSEKQLISWWNTVAFYHHWARYIMTDTHTQVILQPVMNILTSTIVGNPMNVMKTAQSLSTLRHFLVVSRLSQTMCIHEVRRKWLHWFGSLIYNVLILHHHYYHLPPRGSSGLKFGIYSSAGRETCAGKCTSSRIWVWNVYWWLL